MFAVQKPPPNYIISKYQLIAFCAAVTFANGVESQNVVGYQTFDTEIGFNTMSPTFISVGNTDTETKLADIKLGDGATSYTDNIQILDADGNALTQYYWVGEGELDGENPAGWTEDLGTLTDAEIPAGVGFFLEMAVEDVSITMPTAR